MQQTTPMTRLLLDDLRVPAREGWTWVRTASEAIDAPAGGSVQEVSLHHDLGEARVGVASSRALRRSRDRRISRSRRATHLQKIHSDATGGDLDCPCDLASTYFSKRPSVSCGCGRRRRGQPRLPRGICSVGDRDRIYVWRRQTRELSRLLRRRGGNPDDDEIANLSGPGGFVLVGGTGA